jgi:hypothetical protein
MRIERRKVLLAALQAAMITTAGCGTILHPERRGQPPTGRLDWGVVLLDGLGLIFFFIPGLIAFAVDFSTGAIYLPPEYCPPPVIIYGAKFHKLQAPTETPTRAEVAEIVSREIDRPIDLSPGKFVSEPLAKLDEFWEKRKKWLAS